jgi:TonB family protein
VHACKAASLRRIKLFLLAVPAGLAACVPVRPVPAPTPAQSTSFKQQGTAIVRLGVRADGNVAEVTLTQSTGERGLDQLAIITAKKWPFSIESVRGMAPTAVSHVSMALELPLQPGPGCAEPATSATGSNVNLRVVGDGLRGDDPADPQRAIYLTVLTDGCGSSTLSAAWRYDGPDLKPRIFNLTHQFCVTQGPATTVFRVKNPDAWPRGSYHVDIQVNGATVGSRRFVIDRSGLSGAD